MSRVKSRPPLRLIMFTSESCKFCPQVESIVKKFVGSNIGTSVSLTTVDVDLSPETAMQFGIKNLPTVVMGSGNASFDTIVEGYMEAEDIRDRLMNRIFHNVLSGDTASAKRKENLIWLTKNVIDSVQKKNLIRPNIGDYVHLQSLQINNMSILALDPIASVLLYESGRVYGMYGPGQMLLFKSNPNIANQIKIIPKFHELMQAITSIFNYKYFPIQIAESAEIIEQKDLCSVIRLYGSAYAVGAPKIGETLCPSLAGELAGLIQSIMARFVRVEEISCWGTGSQYCEFKIDVLDDEVPIHPDSKSINEMSGKKDVQKRRNIFINTLAEMAENLQSSLMFKKQLRNFGDYVHISVIQQAFTALKIIDPFCGMLLHSAGVTFGLTADKRIINDSLQKRNQTIPISIESAVEIIVEELQHPSTLLTRQHSFVSFQISSTTGDDDKEIFINIHELAYASGATNVEETFCDFMAGFINGRLQLLVIEETLVKEIACSGTGSDVCIFKISIE
ncbi:MAG: V4R domain-containing protein [Candidatus Thorarchaeota archaeon]